jgi:hypothetical protein
MDTTTQKDKLARFGRSVALMLNRSLMYQKSHPMVQDSIKEVVTIADVLFFALSPIVFILNRGQFYVDEEPLDPRINVKRIATIFKNHGIQSVSFENGLTTSELDIFIDIYSSMDMSADAEEIKKSLFSRGVYNIKVNHVLYKKVTEDDQVVSRDALKNVTPTMESEDSQSRKKFMDTLLESILTEEFANTLNIKSLLANPSMVSKNMVQADMASAQKMGASPGPGGGVGGGSGAGPGPGGGGGTGGIGTGPGPGGGGGAGGGSGAGPGPGGGGGAGGGTGAGPGPGGGGGTGGGTGAGPGPGGGGGAGGGTGAGPGPGGGGGAGSGIAKGIGPGGGGGTGGGSGAGPGPGGGGGTGGGTDPGGTSGAGGFTDMAPGEAGHGPMLLHQLELMQQEVQKQLEGQGDASLEDLADAVFEMKKQLFEEIQTQKALGVAYTNENAILEHVNELTDQVLLKLIQEEYQDGNISTKRLAQIIIRLIPDAQELKRLLPQIKKVLLECGMQQETYLEVIEELKGELQNEELSRIIEESAQAIGVESEELVDELKESSGQAAKLIYLASEIRKGTGDESALADILVDYVEQMGREAAKESADDEGKGGDDHLKTVVNSVESNILQQLSKLNVGDDVLMRMEDRINNRMDSILDKMRVEWLNAQTGSAKKDKQVRLTVLQTIEHSVGEDEELEEILKIVRKKVEDGEIEENNFSQINAEIVRQKKRMEEEAEGREMPEGVLSSSELMFILEKEIARANRYSAPFSALAFSFVNAKPTVKALDNLVTPRAVMTAALDKLVSTIREVDYIGQIGKNKMVALLPMIAYPEAKKALSRVTGLLHAEPIMVREVPVKLRVAGVVAEFDIEQNPTAQVFAKNLSNQLMDMVSRLKSIQVLF